jgi:hemolysin III
VGLAPETTVRVKPRLRGVLHEWGCYVSIPLGILLGLLAQTTRGQIAASVFGAAVVVMFGASALHHRITWTPAQRRWTRRLDHAGIFLMIAGSYTPVGLLVLSGAWRPVILAIVWTGALAAGALRLFWVEAPKWLATALGIGLGWVGVVVYPAILHRAGPVGGALVLFAGALYTLGGVVYARGRPNPIPAVFGYHELFHALVIAAVAAQYAVTAMFVLQIA